MQGRQDERERRGEDGDQRDRGHQQQELDAERRAGHEAHADEQHDADEEPVEVGRGRDQWEHRSREIDLGRQVGAVDDRRGTGRQRRGEVRPRDHPGEHERDVARAMDVDPSDPREDHGQDHGLEEG